MLYRTSKSPSILLVSSLAAVIPAPTRSLYASTKSASLLLYQSLAIEHPHISFPLIIPSTVEGDFRASAVDGGPVRESNPNKTGLKTLAVAQRCIQAVDAKDKAVFMPGYMRFAHILYWLFPRFIEWRARVKYQYYL
jgi:short-subunit dehydrogenase